MLASRKGAVGIGAVGVRREREEREREREREGGERKRDSACSLTECIRRT